MPPSDYNYDYFNITFPSQYVAQVEVDRPQKLNAFIRVMWENMGAIFKRLSSDPNVRCVVLTASGDRAFTAGLDVQAAASGGLLTGPEGVDAARRAFEMKRFILDFQDCITAMEKCEKPVIAVLHGISYGIALDIASACDIRLCSRETRFAVKEVDIGIAADVGTLTRLPKANLPLSWIKDVCLTARDFHAQEALQVGLVSGVYENKAATLAGALETARLIASKSPVAVQTTKDIINFSRDHSVADGLNYVAAVNAVMLQSKDARDANLSGIQKRTPTFEKL